MTENSVQPSLAMIKFGRKEFPFFFKKQKRTQLK